jgi:hypothetical protein
MVNSIAATPAAVAPAALTGSAAEAHAQSELVRALERVASLQARCEALESRSSGLERQLDTAGARQVAQARGLARSGSHRHCRSRRGALQRLECRLHCVLHRDHARRRPSFKRFAATASSTRSTSACSSSFPSSRFRCCRQRRRCSRCSRARRRRSCPRRSTIAASRSASTSARCASCRWCERASIFSCSSACRCTSSACSSSTTTSGAPRRSSRPTRIWPTSIDSRALSAAAVRRWSARKSATKTMRTLAMTAHRSAARRLVAAVDTMHEDIDAQLDGAAAGDATLDSVRSLCAAQCNAVKSAIEEQRVACDDSLAQQ